MIRSYMGVSRLQNPTSTDADAETQIRRIEADGGKVVDAAWLRLVIGTLKAQGIYTSCKFLGDANFAFKNAGDNKVSKLYDISGNNNDAVQATAGNQPIWTANVQNGRAGLVFDGVDDYLATAASVVGGTSITALGVGSLTSFTGNYTGHLINQFNTNDSTSNWRLSLGAYSGVQKRDPFFSIVIDSSATYSFSPIEIAFNTCMLLGGTHDGSLCTFYKNGAQIDQDAAIGTMNNIAGLPLYIGREGGGFYSNIKYESGMVFSTALTTAQRTAIEAFANAYYSIY